MLNVAGFQVGMRRHTVVDRTSRLPGTEVKTQRFPATMVSESVSVEASDKILVIG